MSRKSDKDRERRERREKAAQLAVPKPVVRSTVKTVVQPQRGFAPSVSKWARDRISDGRLGIEKAPSTDAERREVYLLKSKRYTPPLPAHVVGKVLPSRVEGHVPTLSAPGVVKAAKSAGLVTGPKADRMQSRATGKAKPALSVSSRACLKANRPPSNKGDGSGRAFVPWCQKGKA